MSWTEELLEDFEVCLQENTRGPCPQGQQITDQNGEALCKVNALKYFLSRLNPNDKYCIKIWGRGEFDLRLPTFDFETQLWSNPS